jgi:hypothetical protein
MGPVRFAIGGGTNPGNLATSDFVGMLTGGSSKFESDTQVPMPLACTLSNFLVHLGKPLGAQHDGATFTVRNDTGAGGADTLVTCTILGGSQDCTDIINATSFAAGNLITIGVTSAGGSVASPMSWTALCSE